MWQVTLFCSALGFAFTTAVAGGQATPNFSGKWMLDSARSVIGGRGNPAPRLTITHDATTLSIERVTTSGSQTLMYKLDGSESKNPAGRGGEATYQSRWEGAKLITTITTQGRGGLTTQTETLTIADGALTIDTSRPDPQGGAPFVSKFVYKKE